MIVEVDMLLQTVGLLLIEQMLQDPDAEHHAASAALEMPDYHTKGVVHMRATKRTGNVTIVIQMYNAGEDTPRENHSFEECVVDYIPNLVAGHYHRTPFGHRGTINA